ncbi:tRNA-dihydrouridine(47) synthase [NAD(P)(+)]-like [Actinia tenebrosa]|uniref:tRNA-dihydrouridine(47) synthase [NAD(P)(+)] n=1 Tax=Actinia tenebrosa TaxID=6105 RepID=A0A6P8IIS9_ACTTE|nr:tRNA-dihydrouridine(47) synthase [NAD(P)(+)]-like [Actinia tenebrosa]
MSEDCSIQSKTCSANTNHVDNTSDSNTTVSHKRQEGKQQDKKLAAGVAHIKKQFLISKAEYISKYSKGKDLPVQNNNQDKNDQENKQEMVTEEEDPNNQESEEPPSKRKKGKQRGMNKKRPRQPRPDRSTKLCSFIANGEECARGEQCHFGHSIQKYLENKPPDIGENCIVFERFGKCNFGINCRFSKNHIDEEYKNIVNEELFANKKHLRTKDTLYKDLQISLRKKKYSFPRSDQYLASLKQKSKAEPSNISVVDEGEIRLRPCEKKKIDFSDKLFLAPLTTVGNLPYRRICKQYGADITCSEMAMCTTLLQGQQSEWALLKRHHTEDIFGVQVCGSFPDTMTKCAELLQKEVSLDFVDINTGCPIDLVFSKGAGCALMERKGKFQEIVKGMVEVLDIPVTVKMRAGVHDDKKTWNAHKLVSNVSSWGASLITVHGRSREQRYTKSADWQYISACAEAAAPVPLFGNGDVLSYEDAMLRREQTGVAGLMIARGSLIKPWIFTEIKEQRHWDISSHERLNMLKEFANCGLEHWGSDTQGVEITRRFLLEWLSFLCRYIPVGLLERPPQRINERPPYYIGRDDLETLMASRYSEDWIKISEMLLGPVPETFTFLPKHKANSYATD